MKRNKDARKNWKYCECGCHHHERNLGPLRYRMFNDLGRGASDRRFHLSVHYRGEEISLGSFTSFEAADRAARAHARPILKELRGELTLAEAAVR